MLEGRHLAFGAVLALYVALAGAAEPEAPPSIRIVRATGPIVVDGDLTDPAWNDATAVERWWETNPGDNVDPKVRSVGRLVYDDKYLYAAFEFDDPTPSKIRAPYADRDNVDSTTDYGGIILDPDNDRKTAILFLANPRGIQYDSMNSDTNGNEDNAPDWFWDSAAKINDHGWTLEIRIPFSSLRYRSADPQTWGILLYRNYPRDFRYQMFSAKLPRGGNCFICRANTLIGLEKLPSGGHVVAAPYGSVSQQYAPADGLGTPLKAGDTKARAGADVKWTPNADNVVDFTVNPDFSQIESDTAQISTNERFALFFSEKRPFFLEGVNLLRTPIQAVYTRTITAPRWGGRLTGKSGGTSYTALVADDKGGGSIVLPGPNGSDLANQEFGAYVLIGRAQREIGRSFVSVLATNRQSHDGQGHITVVGPDFQWRWKKEIVTGQWLFSTSRTPTRPDLAGEWTGQSLSGHALDLSWSHNSVHFDAYGGHRNIGNDFRADTGFVPQVGFRDHVLPAMVVELFDGSHWPSPSCLPVRGR
jgi:hypothetical protein